MWQYDQDFDVHLQKASNQLGTVVYPCHDQTVPLIYLGIEMNIWFLQFQGFC